MTTVAVSNLLNARPEERFGALIAFFRSAAVYMSAEALRAMVYFASTALRTTLAVPFFAIMEKIRKDTAEVTGFDILGPADVRSSTTDSAHGNAKLVLVAEEIAAANRILAARVEEDQVVAQQRIIDEQKALMDSLTAVSALVSTNSITATFGAVTEANNAVAKSIITPELNNTVSTSLTAPVLDLPNVDPASQVTTSFKELPATQPDFVLLPPMQASLYNASSLSLGNGVSSFGVSSFDAPALTFRPAPR